MASYTITIYVEDITSVIAVFNKVRIYRSTTGTEAGRALYDTFNLVEGTSVYDWLDTSGAASYVAWFTYYNSYTFVESGYSDPIQYGSGESDYVPGFSFSTRTYPEEYSLSYDEKLSVDLIRTYIGDGKGVKRDYVSSSSPCLYENVSADGYTYKLSSPPGWPLKVSINNSDFTTLTEPVVNGYEFLTFSGTLIPTTSGSLDVWYENFRHSDREVFWVYQNALAPPYVSTSSFTEDMKCLCAAIMLLQQELGKLMGESSGSFNLQGELSFNPEPVLREKRELLAKLKSDLKALVDESVSTSITGVLID